MCVCARVEWKRVRACLCYPTDHRLFSFSAKLLQVLLLDQKLVINDEEEQLQKKLNYPYHPAH